MVSKELIDKMKIIYDSLIDLKSKKIYLMRVKSWFAPFEIFDIFEYAEDNVRDMIKNFRESLNSIKENEDIIIWGAGDTGILTLNYLKYINLNNNIILCDSAYEKIKNVGHISVISPNEMLENYNNEKIIIATSASKEIKKILLNNNIDEKNILIANDYDLDNQYFDENIINYSDNEIFIDGGAFDGNTSVIFANHINNRYKKIYCFEPDINNMKLINENKQIMKLDNIQINNIGLWHEKDILKFNADSSGGNISDNGSISINVDSLDNLFRDKNECEWPTFIKMDIEGAELNALRGCSEIIKKKKPKLAISIYHKPEDIIEIPLYIMSLVPEYKLYIRHYTSSLSETVLYACL